MRFLFTAGALLLASAAVPAQTLTPREIFYGQYGKDAPPTKPPAPRATKKSVEPAPQASTRPPAPGTSAEKRDEQTTSPAPVRRPDVQYVTAKSETRPLALRYSIVKNTSCGAAEVDPETKFQTGDQIRLVLQANDTGYLYVFQEGSSGKCDKVFPTSSETYRVQAGEKATVPAGDDMFTMSEPSGTEKVFIVFSRESEPGKDLLAALKLCGESPATGERPKAMLAQNFGITGAPGDRIITRDLVIERQKVVDRPAPAPAAAATATEDCKDSKPALGEAAVYVVNRNAGPKGRVVASFELRH